MAGGLPVVGELQGDRDVLRFAHGLDHELKRVLVLAGHTQLVALDSYLPLGGRVLNPLAEVFRNLVGDSRVELDLDLAATLPDGLGVARFEELGRELPS